MVRSMDAGKGWLIGCAAFFVVVGSAFRVGTLRAEEPAPAAPAAEAPAPAAAPAADVPKQAGAAQAAPAAKPNAAADKPAAAAAPAAQPAAPARPPAAMRRQVIVPGGQNAPIPVGPNIQIQIQGGAQRLNGVLRARMAEPGLAIAANGGA